MRAVLFISFLIIGLGGCGSSEKRYPAYDFNSAFDNGSPMPVREKKAKVDFFNRECEKSSDGSYMCRYDD